MAYFSYRCVINTSSCAVGDFYGTGIEIWDGFGPIGITEKKNILELWGQFFQVFVGKKKKNLKN